MKFHTSFAWPSFVALALVCGSGAAGAQSLNRTVRSDCCRACFREWCLASMPAGTARVSVLRESLHPAPAEGTGNGCCR